MNCLDLGQRKAQHRVGEDVAPLWDICGLGSTVLHYPELVVCSVFVPDPLALELIRQVRSTLALVEQRLRTMGRTIVDQERKKVQLAQEIDS